MKKNNRDLRIGFIGLVIVIVLIFIIGLYVYHPKEEIIQGEAVASEVRISGKVPGRIQTILIDEGSQVKKGDTLVVIYSPELTAKIEQATAAQEAASAQNKKAIKGARSEQITGAYELWQKANIGVDITKKSFDRVQRLFDKGIISAQKRDEAEAQYKAAVATANAAKSQYDMAHSGAENEDKMAAQALVKRAQGAVNEVESYLQEINLSSPIDGEISEIYSNQGELVGTGAPIMSVVNLDDIWFNFNIREDKLGSLRMGSTFEVSIPALNKTAKVKISYIKPLASFATWKATKTAGEFDVKTFEVRAKPLTKITDLRPGMTALIEDIKK